MAKRGKGEPAVPEVTQLTNVELVDKFENNCGFEEFCTSAADWRYHEVYGKRLREEILKRLGDGR